MTDYPKKLTATKSLYPFARWQESGLDQYTPEACAGFTAVFDDLVAGLIALGPDAAESDKLACFRQAVEATNALNEEDLSVIESGERDELCELFNAIAAAAGLDPRKYGGGEGPASEWRDW
ncbi:MAG TPA: hypothetical protein VEB66_06985 [Opitutaceae bacterium]|nr:hypothetical protein [Opitutaceae bacterium]